jgi:glycosyltransferase involved in cell wall biosynthesis
MKILLLHNFYQQPGGEDQVFASEARLLKRRGHDVFTYTCHNSSVHAYGRLKLAWKTIWNDSSYRRIKELVRHCKPDVMHVHNTLPLLSPSVYHAAKSEGVTIIQTLHNYRLLCPVGTFFYNGRVCEDCMGKSIPWPSVARTCYRQSRTATAVVAVMLAFHRMMQTYSQVVDRYVALTGFCRQKFIKGGLPAQKVVVKPNFLDVEPYIGKSERKFALFVGRLAPEKGLDTLLDAWKKIGNRLPLKIIGDGPLSSRVAKAAETTPGIRWLGHTSKQQVFQMMGKAAFLIFPSAWYETFGLVAVEAFAKGTPVIASNIGAVAEIVDHGRTGLLFRSGDPEDLALQVNWALEHPAEFDKMRLEAIEEYTSKYTAAKNYELLMGIYSRKESKIG